MSGIEAFATEQGNLRQHGFTESHDDSHSNAEIGAGACCYAMANQLLAKHHTIDEVKTLLLPCWPFEAESWKPSADPLVNLRRAGAMLASEYDRLTRSLLVPA